MTQILALQIWPLRFKVKRFLQGKLKQSSDIDDVMQEVFLKLLSVKSGTIINNPQAYVIKVACGVLWHRRRAQMYARVIMDSELAESHIDSLVDGDVLEEITIDECIEHAVANIPLMECKVMLLCHLYGLSYKEIAQATGLSVFQVERYLLNAKEKIADEN